MLKVEFECRVTAHDEAVDYNRSLVVKQNNFYKFNIDLNVAMMRVIVEYGDYVKIREQEEMEKQGELPF